MAQQLSEMEIQLLEALQKAHASLRTFTHDDVELEKARIDAVNHVSAAIAKASN